MGRRRSGPNAFSLFAFQDIITSVTGIVILITLILALELIERVESSPAEQTREVVGLLDTSIEEMEDEKERLQKSLENTVVDISDLPTTDLSSLTKMRASLAETISEQKVRISEALRKLADRKKQLKSLLASAKAKQDAEELKKISDQNLIAEQKIKEIIDNEQLFFRSGISGKNLWLVEVNDSGFLIAELGSTSKPTRLAAPSEFKTWWRSLDESGNAIFLLTKQSGVESFKFDSAIDDLKNSTFPFGFGVIDESVKVIDPVTGAGN